MKAITLSNPGGPSVFIIKDLPVPPPQNGQVVIRIKAFGINHAETHMRKGEWAEAAEVSGIECVGLVHSCPSGEFAVGSKVAALMGGMGPSINGTYAEYTRCPVSNVAAIESDLSWEELGALPESYATAWTCLFRNLELKEGQTLLVRGATSSFGQAAVNSAVHAGAKVVATTRHPEKSEKLLLGLGAQSVVQEGPGLADRLAGKETVDAVLDLVGNSVLLESLAIARRGGRVCLAGFLGGLAPIAEFNPLLQMPSGRHFSFFGSFHFGTPDFPLSDVLLQQIAKEVAEGRYKAKPTQVFEFEDVMKAHEAMESSQAGGKLVVKTPA